MRPGFILTYAAVGLLFSSVELMRQGLPMTGGKIFWLALGLLAFRAGLFRWPLLDIYAQSHRS